MFLKMNQHPMVWQGEGGGSGGGSEEGSGEGEGEETAPWYGEIDDDLKSVVGDMSAADFIKWGKSQRDGAGKRVDDVVKAEGLVKPVARDGEAGEFFNQFRPETSGEYVKSLGGDPENMTAVQKIDAEAAHAAGMHVDQYKAFTEAQKVARETIDKGEAEKLVNAVKEEWGADYDSKSQSVGRFVKEAGLPETFFEDISNPALGLTSEQYKGVLISMAKMGDMLKEGGGAAPGDAGGAESVDDQLAALEQKAIDNGGNLSADDTRKRDALIEKKYGEAA